MTLNNRPTKLMHAKKKIFKPRSDLQILQSKITWSIHFKLQHFHSSWLKDLPYNPYTHELIATYNITVTNLKRSIKKDYILHRHNILTERKKLLDSKTNP